MKSIFNFFGFFERAVDENQELHARMFLKIAFYGLFAILSILGVVHVVYPSGSIVMWCIGVVALVFLFWFCDKNIGIDNSLIERVLQTSDYEEIEEKKNSYWTKLGREAEQFEDTFEQERKLLLGRDEKIEMLEGSLEEAKTEIASLKSQNKEIPPLRASLETLENQAKALKADALDTLSVSELAQFMVGKFEFLDELSESEKSDLAIMYAEMHEKCPDMERVKELASVPLEIQRLNQIKTITESYSQLISEAENDQSLSETERRDKLKLYRLRRDRELGDDA